MSAKSGLGLLLLLFVSFAVYRAQDTSKQEQKPAPQSAPAATPAQNTHNFKITPEEAAQKNPLRFTDVSVARGKKIYATQCAMCHGEKADGKGDLAQEMGAAPPDFTKPETLKKRTDGELFAIIGSGNDTMPGEGSRMSDYYKWCLINYLRSLTNGETPLKATSQEIEKDQQTIIKPQ